MNYRNPQQVTSPRDFVEAVEVIHDGGEDGISVARLNWEGSSVIGIRWNVARREWDDEAKQREERECVGMPSSHGHPVWFVLPEDLIERDSEVWTAIESSLQSE
jgi:hypothetical protein